MPLCDKCGVRYEDGIESCPLCAMVSEKPEKSEQHDSTIPASKHFREVLFFVCFSCSLIIFITDIAYGMNVSWSKIPLISIGYVWVTCFLVSILVSRKYLALVAGIGLTGVYLFLLGVFTSDIPWFSDIAFPILLSLGLLTVVATGAIRLFKLSFAAALSVCLVCAGLFTICIDLAVTPGVSWSLVTASGVIPIVLFLAGFQKRLQRKGSNLRKYFFA